MTPLERAMQQVERFLETLSPDTHLQAAIDTLIGSGEPSAMELVADVAGIHPERVSVDMLWATVEDASVEVDARVEAVRAITQVLLNAYEDLELDLPFDDDEEPLMSESDFDAHVSRLMGTYRAADYPEELRRRALECAANVSDDPTVAAAGHAAFRAEDSEWVATGVLVIALTDVESRAAVVAEALEHADEEVRITAIHALGLSEEDEDVQRLAHLAEERSGEERIAALESLSGVGREVAGEALAYLVETLEGEPKAEAEAALATWIEQWAGFDEDLDDEFDEIGEWDEDGPAAYALDQGDDPEDDDPDDGGLNGTQQR